jgi:hypothetical protein
MRYAVRSNAHKRQGPPAIALEIVDGGEMEDVRISDIKITDSTTTLASMKGVSHSMVRFLAGSFGLTKRH